MSIIYVPKGRAREYSPLAANLFEGCSHGCKYCYAPGIRHLSPETYSKESKPRAEILSKIKDDCETFQDSREQVLLSFIGDPYCPEDAENGLTRSILSLFLENRIPTAILTKGGHRALRDMDIIKSFGRSIKVGATLTFSDSAKSLEWEPGAALPGDRIDTLLTLKEAGVNIAEA